MTTLESLGWTPAWAEHFQPFVAAGFFPGRVCAEHRELYQCHGANRVGPAQVAGRLRHQARGRADYPAVGDWVALRQAPGASVAVIQAILPRVNTFSRKLPGSEIEEQILAANLDILFLVTSCNRDLNPRRIERYLVAAAVPYLRPVVILNKSDLCDRPIELVEEVRALLPGVAVHAVSARTGEGMDELAPYLARGRTSALVGSSGVGKSTLLNRLLGQQRQAAHAIRDWDDRGRHTTTHRELFFLPQGGLLIDNPGLRMLQLWDEGADLEAPFADVATLAARCHFPGCQHQSEPRCAVRQALAEGVLTEGHFENYCKLQRELAYLEARHNDDVGRARKERERRCHRTWNKVKRRRGDG